MKYRYKTAEQSRAPGYLAKRFAAHRRLARIKAAQSSVVPLKAKVVK